MWRASVLYDIGGAEWGRHAGRRTEPNEGQSTAIAQPRTPRAELAQGHRSSEANTKARHATVQPAPPTVEVAGRGGDRPARRPLIFMRVGSESDRVVLNLTE